MGAFKFRLESYFKLKVHEEKSAWNEVLKQQGRVSKLQEAIDTIKEAMGAARAGLSESGSNKVFRAGEASIVEESLSGLTVKIQNLLKEKSGEERTLEMLKQKYAEKKRDAKILENLKDRKLAEYSKEQAKLDDRNIEEIARMMTQARKLNHE